MAPEVNIRVIPTSLSKVTYLFHEKNCIPRHTRTHTELDEHPTPISCIFKDTVSTQHIYTPCWSDWQLTDGGQAQHKILQGSTLLIYNRTPLQKAGPERK